MKKAFITLFILISAATWPQTEDMIRQWKETTWRLNILLKGTLHGGAVQFAIMDHDPVNGFREDCRRLREKSGDVGEQVSEGELSINDISILSVAWDKQFMEIKGDEVYLLIKNEMCGFSSNTGGKRYYLVTKTAVIGERPAAWVIPFDAVTGSEQDITLDDSSALDLDKISR